MAAGARVMWLGAKECKQPLEDVKGQKQFLPKSLLEETQPLTLAL